MNYKIKVNNEAESKEAQGLFFKLGYVWHDTKCKTQMRYIEPVYYSSFDDMELACDVCDVNYKHKEITIPELRDLVVLKRDNVGDATHGNESAQRGYLASDGVEYIYDFYDKKWRRFPTLTFSSSKLKPIEKPMKEYLNKETHEFVRSHSELNDMWIEIPEWANFAAFNQALNNYYFNKENIYIPDYVIWQRHPEETLNDKVVSAEIARQESKEWDLGDYAFAESDDLIESNVEQGVKHLHYKKDVKHLDYIDVYRVLELFEVESHAVGHAVKKLLCSGQRGAKDEIQDIQEAIDSLNRHIEMIKENDVEL